MESRRTFLRVAALGAAGAAVGTRSASAKKKPKTPEPPAAAAVPVVKPRALKPGDTVGLIAPASYTFDLWSLDDAAARVEALA